VGLFKQAKDMKNLIGAAPEMLSAAQQMSEQSQELAAAHQAIMQQTAPPAAAAAPPPAGPDFAPIGGVSLELYVEISKELGAHGYDQSQAAGIAAGKGITADGWRAALDGWNARIRANAAVAQRFNALYTGA
jgi:hypothetical protein